MKSFLENRYIVFHSGPQKPKKQFKNIFPRTRRCSRYMVVGFRPGLKNIRHLKFSILKFIFLHNDGIEFFHEGHQVNFHIYGWCLPDMDGPLIWKFSALKSWHLKRRVLLPQNIGHVSF